MPEDRARRIALASLILSTTGEKFIAQAIEDALASAARYNPAFARASATSDDHIHL